MSDYIMLFDRDGQPYIAHHGILGQKWGVRRYQNKDGTRTAEGKKRYSINPKVSESSKKLIEDRRELDRLGWSEYNKTWNKRWENRQDNILNIIDNDSIISKKLKEADKLASKFDEDPEKPGYKYRTDLTENEEKQITADVNRTVKEALDRYEDVLKQSGATKEEAAAIRESAEEDFWLRVHNFGY